MRGQFHSVCLKFFLRIHITGDFAPNFLARFYLAQHFAAPVMGHMAIGTDGAHAGSVLVVDGFYVLLIHVIAHFMAADTESQLVGRFQPGVESAPEQDAGEEADDEQGEQRILGARPLQYSPYTLQKTRFIIHCIPPLKSVSYTHLTLPTNREV